MAEEQQEEEMAEQPTTSSTDVGMGFNMFSLLWYIFLCAISEDIYKNIKFDYLCLSSSLFFIIVLEHSN